MESRLQSNEVRIPKPKTTLAQNLHAVYATTSVGNASTNGVGGGVPAMTNGTSANGDGQTQQLPDFDLTGPCQYFKSSFARSLSISTSNQTKSLDFGINFGLARSNSIREEQRTPTASGMENSTFSAQPSGDTPPPLPQSQPPALNGPSRCNYTISGGNTLNYISSHQTPGIGGHTNSGLNNGYTGSSNPNTRNVWAPCHKQNSQRRSFDTAEIEVLRLRKECQNLVEENRRLVGLASGIVGGNLVVPGNSPNIEAVILQTQVDTLQWQLKQVEASRQMYRAVMEEVVRFLERCHRNLDAMQNGQIARSKSVYHVHQNNDSNSYISNTNSNDNSNQSSPRARSSINLLDTPKNSPVMSTPNSSVLGSSTIGTPTNSSAASTKSNSNSTESTPSSPASSYNNFRDFTWRRSPKRAIPSPLAAMDCDVEKLSQEAFRLLRTAQNLLNTQEPVLLQSKQALELQYDANITPHPPPLSSLSSISTSSLGQNSNQPLSLAKQHALKSKSCEIDPDTFCMTFSRKMNMRESRLSLRSSTDDSVHSNSSSKNETDEEILTISNHSPPTMKEIAACSTEDESGFSSISSFQEIGLPLNFTMISTSTSVAHSNSSTSDDSGECHNVMDTYIENDSRNSTLKASQSPLLAKVGLPLPHSHHRRWDSAPAVPPRGTLHSFSTLPGGDDAPRVLWV